jgi:hypothetical protein
MASSGQVELYSTDFALEASGASYKGLIIVNKVRTAKLLHPL